MVYLDQRYVYRGLFYGPGETDLPDDVASALRKRGAFRDGDDNSVPDAPESSERNLDYPWIPKIEGLSPEQHDALLTAGYTTLDRLRQASDRDLWAVPTIGQAAVRRIREALGE